MTCIAGIVTEDHRVFIGGDGRSTFGYYQSPTTQQKVARVGETLIGVAGMPRIAQLLFSSKEVPPTDQLEPMDYLVGPFADWLRVLLNEKEAMSKEDSDSSTKTSLLIGLQGRLFMIDGRLAVYESKRGFDAIGTGTEVALGYLTATVPILDPESAIIGALRASADILPAVGPPYCVKEL